nr:hypothetical protein [Tanacetum cinerariifolium]
AEYVAAASGCAQVLWMQNQLLDYGQWKFLIHTILQSLSAKRTFWNEFSTSMASAVICLSKGQRFNFSRVGKGFLGVETPLFENMLAVRDVDAEEEIVKLKARVKKLEKLNKIKSSKLRRLRKVGTSQRVESSDDEENVFNQRRISVDIDQDEGIELVVDQEKDTEIEGSMQEDDTEVQEAVEVVTTGNLITEVVTAAATQVVAASTPITVANPKVLKIAAAAPAVSTRKRKGVVIRDPEEELHTETPAETLTVKDKGKGILIEDPKPINKKDQVEMDTEYARKLLEELDKENEKSFKNIDWNAVLDHIQSKEP